MHNIAPGIRKRQRQQWLALVLCFACLVTGLAWWPATQRASLIAEEGTRLRTQVHMAQRHLARQLGAIDQTLVELIHEFRRWKSLDQFYRANASLLAMTLMQAGARTITVLDADGYVLASSRNELIGLAFDGREFFQTAKRGNDAATLYLSPPYRTSLGVYTMNASRVIQDEDGRFAGVVAATLDPEYLALLIGSVNFSPDMWTSVTHDSGALVVMNPARPDLEGRNLLVPGSMFARHRAAGTAQTLFRGTVAITGDRRLIAQETVHAPNRLADHALVVAVSRSEQGILAGWNRLAWGAAAMSCLLLAVAAGGLRWVQHAERLGAEQLAESLDRLDRIGQTAPGVICQFVLHPDGRASMPYATQPLQPYFGVPVSTEPGSADAMFRYIDPAHVDAMRSEILESARTMQPYRHEFLIRVPGQPERWLNVHSVPQRRDDGSTVWTGLVMEATAQHAAREAQVALDAAQRANLAKSEFLSRASHELRTPLNAVIGFAGLLLGHPHDDGLTAAQRKQIGFIHDAGQHLLALINDLLDVSSIESGRVHAVIENVDVPALLDEVMSTLREQAGASDVQLTSHVDAPALAARADRLRLKQVLLNLVSNAIKYNRPGGSVTLALNGSPDEGVHIEVRDTGEGLSPEQREHLFEPFNRLGADRRGIAGTGIGLTIAKMLVELMHGRIEVDSAAGSGSRFVVHLPAANAPAGAATVPAVHLPLATAPALAPGFGLRVLYVEDNPMNALFMQQLAELRPYVHLTVVASGAEALAAVQREVPDLALVDLHLGDMSGFDVLARLRADPRCASLRCAALTADALPATEQRAAAAGFFEFMTKPIDIRLLLRLIDREALAKALRKAA